MGVFLNKLKSVLGLSLQLAKANFKLRNEGSYLGIFWYLLEPLFMFLIIMFIRGAFRIGDIPHYPIYLLIGLILFNFFRQSTSSSVDAITNNASFIKSRQITKESLVISKVLQSVYSHFFEIILLIIFLVIFGVSLKGLIFYPLVFVLLLIFIFGASFLLSVIGVYINDFGNVWGIFTRLLWFGTPLFYVIKEGTGIYFFNLFNPMYYFITITRDIIINNTIEIWMVGIVLGVSLFLFFIGFLIFEKYKNKFAEMV
jgi:ABC-type polysaccharide/polyol phosphate export permease